MLRIIQTYVDLCLLRVQPQDLPHSRLLQLLTLLAYALVSTLSALINQPLWSALLTTGVDVILLLALASVSLWIVQKPERSVQTITAIAGCGVILGLIGWPVMLWLNSIEEGTSAAIPSLLLLSLVVWNITVIGHILRHALEIAFGFALGIALLYMYLSLRIVSALYLAAGNT